MKQAIYVSINKRSVEKIILQIKNHEFRNYIPKEKFNYMYVYTTSPMSRIQYIMNISEIVEYPNLINFEGDSNHEFNNGQKAKYAYKIKSVYELKNPILLNELKEKYGFNPPQAFAYGDRYLELSSYIDSQEKRLVLENIDEHKIRHKR